MAVTNLNKHLIRSTLYANNYSMYNFIVHAYIVNVALIKIFALKFKLFA